MYAKYVTVAGAVAADVALDLAMLCTGATIASLSASCNKTSSSIVSALVAPGWTLVDNAPAGGGAVISCPDAESLYTKRVKIYGALSNSAIGIIAVETWDLVNHTTTNSANSTALAASAPPLSGTVPNVFHLFCTPRTIYYMVPTGIGVGIGCVEFSRDAAYLQGTVYPAHVIINHKCFTVGDAPSTTRMKNLNAGGDLVAPQSFVVCTLAARSSGGAPVVAPLVQFRDATESLYYEVRPIWIGWWGLPTTGTKPLILGKLYDFVETAQVAGNLLNTFTEGINTWFIVTDETVVTGACVALKGV